jgi:hypothetical protein
VSVNLPEVVAPPQHIIRWPGRGIGFRKFSCEQPERRGKQSDSVSKGASWHPLTNACNFLHFLQRMPKGANLCARSYYLYNCAYRPLPDYPFVPMNWAGECKSPCTTSRYLNVADSPTRTSCPQSRILYAGSFLSSLVVEKDISGERRDRQEARVRLSGLVICPFWLPYLSPFPRRSRLPDASLWLCVRTIRSPFRPQTGL